MKEKKGKTGTQMLDFQWLMERYNINKINDLQTKLICNPPDAGLYAGNTVLRLVLILL